VNLATGEKSKDFQLDHLVSFKPGYEKGSEGKRKEDKRREEERRIE
jgi:hypothetical protein